MVPGVTRYPRRIFELVGHMSWALRKACHGFTPTRYRGEIGRAGGRIERDTFFLVCTFQKTAFKNMSLVLDTVAHAKEPY